MIGRLTGILLEKNPPQLLLDVHGVGYEVEASLATFNRLPAVGEQITLHTHFVVREDAQLLYGFADIEERRLFRALIKVNGVGPKLAITILSGIAPENFVTCIVENDTASLIRLPGVGKKTAERLVVEMRDYLADWASEKLLQGKSINNIVLPDNLPAQRSDAISALIALGYKPQEATKAVNKIARDDLSSAELIKLALQQF